MPDGTPKAKKTVDPKNKIKPHYASIFVDQCDVIDDSKWWKGRDIPMDLDGDGKIDFVVRQFPVKRQSEIVMSGMDSPGSFDDKQFDQKSVKLRRMIRIDLEKAVTIVRMPLRRGQLVSRFFLRALIAILKVKNHKGEVVITAWPWKKKLVLKPGTELVIANMSKPGGARITDSEERKHFRLYAQLDYRKRYKRIKSPKESEIEKMHAPPMKSTHPFVRYLKTVTRLGGRLPDFGIDLPEAQCSVTGCCDASECGG